MTELRICFLVTLALIAFAADSVLAELLSLRLVMAGIAVLGGIGLWVLNPGPA